MDDRDAALPSGDTSADRAEPTPPPALIAQPPAEPLPTPPEVPMPMASGPIVRPGPPPRVFEAPERMPDPVVTGSTRVRQPKASTSPEVEASAVAADQDPAGPPPILWRGLIVLPWIFATSSVLSVVLGAALFSLGMSLRQAVLSAVIGIGLTLVPLVMSRLGGAQRVPASWSPERATFGVGARGVPIALIHLSRTLWAAIALWIVAEAVAQLAVVYGLSSARTAGPLAFGVLVFALAASVFVPRVRPRLLAKARIGAAVVAMAFAVLFVVITARAIDVRVALTFEDGPWIRVVGGATLVFSALALLWVTLPPLGRARRNLPALRRSDPVAALVASVVPLVLIVDGAILAASSPALAGRLSTAPMAALASLVPAWFGLPLAFAVAFGLISVVSTSAQTGGVAIRRLGFGFSDGASTLIAAGVIGLLAVILTGLVDDTALVLRDLVTTLAVPVATWFGAMSVAIALRRARRSGPGTENNRSGHVTALIGVALALVVGFGLTTASMSALKWEGYLFALVGLPRDGDVASSGIGILAAFAIAAVAVVIAPRIGQQVTPSGADR